MDCRFHATAVYSYYLCGNLDCLKALRNPSLLLWQADDEGDYGEKSTHGESVKIGI